MQNAIVLLWFSLFSGTFVLMGCGSPTNNPDGGNPEQSTSECKANSDCSTGLCENGKCKEQPLPEKKAEDTPEATVEPQPETQPETPQEEKPSCQPGTSACRCTPTGACFNGLRCDNGICSVCNAGTVGCACKDGKTCESGLKCEGGLCSGCVGKDKCPCHGNNTCEQGHRCVISTTGNNKCQLCEKDSMQDCACKLDSECGAKLACVNNRCMDLALANKVPQSPRCYSPCDGDVKMPDGTIRACHPEYKLMEGCLVGQTCLEGSCVANSKFSDPSNLPTTQYPFCFGDSTCASWQACVQGRCYSTCRSTSECEAGFKCYSYVCRRECNTRTSACGQGYFCSTQGSDDGVCVPHATNYNPDPPVTSSPGTFHIPFHNVPLSNSQDTGEFYILNKGTFSAKFKITRKNDTIASKNPLYWLKLDKCKTYNTDGRSCKEFEGKPTAAEPFEAGDIEAGKMLILRVSNANGKPSDKSAYEGTFLVDGGQLGTQDVNVNYRAKIDGQWKGTMVAFGNFDDTAIDKFPADNAVNIRDIPNAFLRRWMNYKRNEISFDKFMAALQSIKSGSWTLKKVADDCRKAFSTQASSDVLCYPYSSSAGYEILSISKREAPVPSGTSELKFVANIKETDSTSLEGRIETSQSLQYAGTPRVDIKLMSDLKTQEKIFLKSFSATIDLGGRFYVGKDESCPNTTDYEKTTVPWLVPGFELMSEPRTGSLFRDRFECRSKLVPKKAPAGASSKLKEEIAQYNVTLSAANPIPNGWRMRRQLELVDGALIDNQYLFVIYRERFVSFFPQQSGSNTLNKDFINYGYMLLTRSSTEMKEEEFTGSAPEAMTACTSSCTGGLVCQSGYCREPSKLNQVVCSNEIVNNATGKSATSMSALQAWSSSDLENLATALIDGQSTSIANNTALHIKKQLVSGKVEYSYTDNGQKFYVHYLCEDTGQFNGGPENNEVDCPTDSKVIFFEVLEVSEQMVRDHACQANKTCFAALAQYRSTPKFRENISYKCEDSNTTFCDSNRKDLREGKIFFREPTTSSTYVSPFQPLRNVLFEAFRYRIKFQSRSGQSIGFTPTLCSASSSSLTPYCYDPKVIEKIEQRVNCLEAMFADETIRNKLGSNVRAKVKSLLEHAFAYTNSVVGGVILTDPGFEMLNAELKVMLGDEAYTLSFASRYDLAGSNLVSFQGELFEPNGINLSGALGFEMYNLYLSTQYYQMVLDRFFSQANVIYQSFQSQDRRFITANSVTSYFQKLLLASTRKARSWSQIAKRYHQLNRPDLSRTVIERAYTATFMEMSILTRFLRELIVVLDRSEIDQVSSEIDKVALIYKSSLLDMEETYKNLNQSLNHFGLAEGAIPFPAMDSFSALTGSTNAFQVALNFAKEKMYIARSKEQTALQTKRSFDTSSASFQNELVRIEQNYENQLLEICGGISVQDQNGQTQIYPAIPRYSVLSDSTKQMGDPCGRVSGGLLFNAYAELDKGRLSILSLSKSQENINQQIVLEQERIQKYCDAKFALADITWKYKEKQKNLQLEMEETQRNVERTVRIGQTLSQAAEMVKCSLIAGTANGGDCPTAPIAMALILGIGVVQEATVTILEQQIVEKRKESLELDQQLEKTQLLFECRACDANDGKCATEGTAQLESRIRIKEFTNNLVNLNFEALKAEYDLRILASNITRLQQRAKRLMSQQDEATQLSINVQAAQNDPNVRIYKNDAIISAERTFDEAMQEAYRATIIYEYYTGTSYKYKGDLYLIRMISSGDKNLENYLSQLEQAFREFEEENGKPDVRVLVLSLRDDVMKVDRTGDSREPKSNNDRVSAFQKLLTSRDNLNEEGYVSIPFSLPVARSSSPVSPVTFNHKVLYVEAEIQGTDVGNDGVGRIYLRQKGTGLIRLKGDEIKYYTLPQRTAVINPYFNGTKIFTPEIYRNFRLRDRPLGNTQWEVLINQVTEKANQDINLNSISDIVLYIYYADFTEEK